MGFQRLQPAAEILVGGVALRADERQAVLELA